ncbi:hypothetical protein C8J57DRAFT_1240071 [Mycena rebaudengoi]|nr:hypothetical protein C8J57DRAFT_1240071 [Mycena rebaudengoi]
MTRNHTLHLPAPCHCVQTPVCAADPISADLRRQGTLPPRIGRDRISCADLVYPGSEHTRAGPISRDIHAEDDPYKRFLLQSSFPGPKATLSSGLRSVSDSDSKLLGIHCVEALCSHKNCQRFNWRGAIVTEWISSSYVSPDKYNHLAIVRANSPLSVNATEALSSIKLRIFVSSRTGWVENADRTFSSELAKSRDKIFKSRKIRIWGDLHDE